MIPQNIQELTINACIYLESKGYKFNMPDIRWRHGTSKYSSGTCYVGDHITITGGKLLIDRKMVLLHELAHWILPITEHHSEKFWDIAWDLYRRFKIPINHAKHREFKYKKTAIVSYRKNKKTDRI